MAEIFMFERPWSAMAVPAAWPGTPLLGRWGGMIDKPAAYSLKQGGAVVEDTVCGFNIVVHHPTKTGELEKRVAKAHADAVIAKVKKLNCSAKQKKELIDAICT